MKTHNPMHRFQTSLVATVLFVAVFAPTASGQVPATEADFYKIQTLPIPEGIELEVGGLDVLPDGQLAVSTRRGEIWLVKNPYMAGGVRPQFKRFAHGLHEALGLAWRDGVIYAAQRSELTRLTDTNGDDRADLYETVFSWPLEGNYHEYSYGPLIRPDGTMIVTLNLAWIGFGASLSKWRGWMLEIQPDGTMKPFATGMRSPAGFGFNMEGDVFYGENQGDWIGSGYITHVERGDFVGNPAGLKWTGLPGSPLALKPEDIPDSGRPLAEVAAEVPALKRPAVWLPHTLMGISTSDILADTTKGGFGPFDGQLFVGDQGQSRVMRVFLEKVNGVYQGAAFPFREGFSSGVLRLVWGKDSSMFVGMTNRGWGSTGPAPFGVQRLEWTGRMPFEVKTIEARPDGFELTFTKPISPQEAASLSSYEVTGFTYMYHSTYGSPIINRETAPVRRVAVAADGMSARIAVDGLRRGYIHEIKLTGLRSADGEPLLHDTAYYTLNEIPGGTRMSAAAGTSGRASASTPAARPRPVQAKRQTTQPTAWRSGPESTVTVGTKPGLLFDKTLIEVRAGSRLKLVFNNNDDMMHNLLIVRVGAGNKVGTEAITMGLDGVEKDYVPNTADVLFHTSLLKPETSESIFFTVPEEPGDYEFICTFPGHFMTMRGVLRVVKS